MDVRFNSDAANELIYQMDLYCKDIQYEARSLLALLESTEEWDDYQKDAFQLNVKKIADDLNEALQLEADYMKIYYRKVQELRG